MFKPGDVVHDVTDDVWSYGIVQKVWESRLYAWWYSTSKDHWDSVARHTDAKNCHKVAGEKADEIYAKYIAAQLTGEI